MTARSAVRGQGRAPATGGTRRAQASGAARRRGWAGALFFAPFFAVLLIGVIAPIVYAVYLSLFRDQLIGGRSFVGLGNYLQAMADSLFHDGLGRVALFMLVQVPIMLSLSVLMALAIDSGRLAKAGIFRVVVFLPYAVPAVVATLMWGYIYGDEFGLVGQVSAALGVNAPNLLSHSGVLLAIGNISTWSFVGYNMLILYSALRVVPTEIYEAARVDGASTWRIAMSIKFPAIRAALLLTVVFSIIGSFQLFNEPNVLRTLAPTAITSHYTPNMYTYNLAFAGQQAGYAAAIAIVLGVVTVVAAMLAQTANRRLGGEQ